MVSSYRFFIGKCETMKNILLASAFLLVLMNPVEAKDIYISQNANGNDTGINCQNSHSVSWINSMSNWGDTYEQVSVGDTIHLCGILISPITIQGSGIEGYPITILFERDSKFSVPVLNDSSFITVSKRSNITIDGGSNGVIETTNNGTGLAYQKNIYGIYARGVSNLIIKNLNIKNLYNRTAFSNDGKRFGVGLSIGGSDITVQNCSLSGGDTMVAISYGTGSYKNIKIQNNNISKCNHGISIGAYQINSYLNNVLISNNRINDLDIWEGHSGLHLDGIIIFNEAPDFSGSISNLQIKNNYIGPNIGNTNTAGVFILTYRPSQASNISIYNNVFTSIPPYYWTNGFIRAPGKIYNNTIVSSAGGIGINTNGNSEIKNNIIFIQSPSGSCTPIGVHDLTSTNINNNLYFCNGKINIVTFDNNGTALFYNYQQWKKKTGFDSNSIIADPQFVNVELSNFRLRSTSPAVNSGLNLGQYYSPDKDLMPRAQSGPWDIGAYQYRIPSITAPQNQIDLHK